MLFRVKIGRLLVHFVSLQSQQHTPIIQWEIVDIFPPPPPELILCFLYIPNPAGLTWKFWIICFPLDIYQILGEYIEYCNVCWYSHIPSHTRPSSPKLRRFISKFFLCVKKRENVLWENLRAWEQGVNHSQENISTSEYLLWKYLRSEYHLRIGLATGSQPLFGRWDSIISYHNIRKSWIEISYFNIRIS